MSDPPPVPTPYPNLATLYGRVLVDELARAGLRHAVVAPGSRSAPLAWALAAHPDVDDRSAIDERVAAFAALGLARATGRPVAVVTTSGTAAANLHPAVLEADRDGVPLLLLTADRPPAARDAGDSQAADQLALFGRAVRWFHEAGEPAGDPGNLLGRLAALRSTAGHAWARAAGLGGPPGPVHLNLAYAKPLAPEGSATGAEVALDDPEAPAVAGRPGGRPWQEVVAGGGEPAEGAVERLAAALAGARRPLVMVGTLPAEDGRRLRAPLARLLAALPVPVWAEATSGLRFDPARPAEVVGAASLLLASERFRERARPDLVVRLGKAPLDWPLRSFAARLAAAGTVQVQVSADGRRSDPEHAPGWTIEADPARLAERLAPALAAALRERGGAALEAGWSELHRRAARAAEAALGEAVAELAAAGPLFDGAVLHRLGRRLPEDAALVVSSSMPMRELESFVPATGEDVDVFANRGLNGIDGVTATALGVAAGRRAAGESRTLLVTGDVALAHDLGGLAEAGRWGEELTIVLVDNGGGAIFDHLPGAGTEPGFERHFTTPPRIDWERLAAGLGIEYHAPADLEALDAVLARPASGPRLVRVETDRTSARARRRELATRVATTLDPLLAEVPEASGSRVKSGSCEVPEASGPEVPEASGGPSPEVPPEVPEASGTPVESGSCEVPEASGRLRRVVLVHGFTGSPEAWDGLLGRLPGVRAVRLALPGHAGEPVSAGLDFSGAVDGLLGEVDRRLGGGERPWLVGYSMGGRLALAAALEAPERFAGLILIGASPGIEEAAGRAERAAADDRLAEELERDGLAVFVDRWMALALFASQARRGHRFLRRARARRLAGSARGWAAALRALTPGRQPPLWERLGELRLPVLLVVGEEDAKYRELARRMAGRLPCAELAVVPGTGHAPHEEDPAAVAARVARALGTA